MDYTKLLEQSPKILFAILIAGVLFLVAPASVLGSMSLNDFWLRPYIGIVTILAAALLVAHGAAYLIERIKSKKAESRKLENSHRVLHSLTPAEKIALQPYIFESKNTSLFKVNDGVAGGLVAKGVLYVSSNVGFWYSFPHNLQPWARKHLTDHPQLLQVPEGEFRELEADED